jgi:hypothetical protein
MFKVQGMMSGHKYFNRSHVSNISNITLLHVQNDSSRCGIRVAEDMIHGYFMHLQHVGGSWSELTLVFPVCMMGAQAKVSLWKHKTACAGRQTLEGPNLLADLEHR